MPTFPFCGKSGLKRPSIHVGLSEYCRGQQQMLYGSRETSVNLVNIANLDSDTSELAGTSIEIDQFSTSK